MGRFGIVTDRVQRLIPGRERFVCVGIDVAARFVVPDRQPVGTVDRPVTGWPPHLVIGRRRHLPEQDPRDRAAHRRMQVRRQPPLRLQTGEVLNVPADCPAHVLPEPINQLGKMDRVAGRPPVVIAVRVQRRALRRDPTVAVAGQRQEHRRSPHRPVRSGERPPDGAPIHRQPGQVRGILPPFRRPGPPGPIPTVRRSLPANAEIVQRFVHLRDQIVDFADLIHIVAGHGVGADRFEIRPELNQRLRVIGWRVGVGERFVIEMPPRLALRHPELAGTLRTRRALGCQGGPARHRDDLSFPGDHVDPAHRQRADAHPVLRRDCLQDMAGERLAQAGGPAARRRFRRPHGRGGHAAGSSCPWSWSWPSSWPSSSRSG